MAAVSRRGCVVAIKQEVGFQCIRLENGRVAIEVFPELGGKIWNLWDRERDIQWLWQNPQVGLRKVSLHSPYDNNWAGGWEELFPNDAPGPFMGRDLPDHGEWWSRPWQWEIVEDGLKGQASIRLMLSGLVMPMECEKTITVSEGESAVRVQYRMTNWASEPLKFLFKQHLAVAVTPRHRIELPGGMVVPVSLEFSTRIGAPGPFRWPVAQDRAGGQVNLSLLPSADERHQEFVYVAGMPEGWCGVRDTKTGASLHMRFSLDVFPYTWLFMSFGGWRDLYTVVLEPCTNMPKDLAEAVRLGRCATLAGHDTLDCEVTVTLS